MGRSATGSDVGRLFVVGVVWSTAASALCTPGYSEIAPTGKSFEVDFTVALWDDGQIVEGNVMYDLVTFTRQLGLSGLHPARRLRLRHVAAAVIRGK